MLKTIVGLLLVGNLGFYAWSQGWIDGGAAARSDREPERLARQVRPESVRILPPAGADTKSRGATPASAPAAPNAPAAPSTPAASAPAASAAGAGEPMACLQSGPYTPAEVPRLEAALHAALPSRAGGWTHVRIDTPGIWLVYMGKFNSREAMQLKLEELARFRGLVVEEVRNAAEFEPGLALGRHDSRTAAASALARLADRGIRTARVVALSPPASVVMLRFERAEPTLQAQLFGLPGASLGGTSFVPCPPVVAGPVASSSAT